MAKRQTKPSKDSSKATATIDTADDRILTTEELLERVPLDRSTIWRMSREGRFPAPLQLTRSRIGWRWSAILAWLSEREANPIRSRQYFGKYPAENAVSQR